MKIIIPCGGRKNEGIWQAWQLYTGPYFKSCLKYALSIADKEDIFILSAKHGLLALTDRIESYDMQMGQPGSVTVEAIRKQATDRGIIDSPAVAIGGKKYTDMARRVWSECLTPLSGVGGIGKQMGWLKAHRGQIASIKESSI